MEGLKNAYILRINKREAGKTIPFDRIYLLHKADQELFPRIFANAMVFPINTGFSNQITGIIGKNPTSLLHSFTRFGEEKFQETLKQENIWEEFHQKRHNYLALVPILFTRTGSKLISAPRFRGRKKAATFAAYLVARPGTKKIVGLVKKVTSTRAYFLIDRKRVQPLCLACPRHQHALQNECHLGQVECFQYLARSKPADMVRGLALYDEIQKQINEPPLELKEEKEQDKA